MIMELNIINLSTRPSFMIGPYEVVSQQPLALKGSDRGDVISSWLPIFMYVWREIERVTSHRWKCTSYIRNSPSHSLGQSMDLAPDIAPSAMSSYGVYRQSDPVLYKRAPLIRALQSLNFDPSVDRFLIYEIPSYVGIGLFIESDHIHMQILSKDESAQRFSVIKWGIAKPLYSDTYQRKVLPFTEKQY